jgi:UDPglucose 6-dehydrogenase
MKIGVIGLGKLGLPVAVAIDNKGHDVLGYDINPNINSSKRPIDVLLSKETDETGKNTLTPMLESSTLKFADNVKDVIEHSEIIFIAIQTPHQKQFEGHMPMPDERCDFNYNHLVQCMETLNAEINELKQKKIVTIISTVLPGTLRKYILPTLSPYIELCYNPFFIAMGTVVFDFFNPEFILLGRVDSNAEHKVTEFYKTINNASVYSTTLENAELIKVSYNTFITTKLVLVNNIMEMCHKLPNTNVDEVTNALKLGTRRLVSPSYLTGGMGDGGGCHPRDNIAMSWLNNELGIEYNFFDFIMKKREKQTEFFVNIIEEKMKEHNLEVCILGKSFKPETNMVEGSPAVLVGNLLSARNISYEHYDPHTDIERADEFILKKYVYFIGCKHSIFQTYNFPEGSCVIDPNRYIPLKDGIDVIHIGVGKKI